MDGWMGRPRTRAVPATVDGAGSAPIPTAAASAMEMEAGPLSHQRRPKARWICTQMRDGIHPLISGGAASADAGTSPTSPTTTAGITMACSARVVGFLLSAMPRSSAKLGRAPRSLGEMFCHLQPQDDPNHLPLPPLN